MYMYQAELWCDECGRAIRAALKTEGKAPANPDLADSDEFPQYYLESQSETDSPNHCPECGVLLEENLTSDGVECVVQALVDNLLTGDGDQEILAEWAAQYSDCDARISRLASAFSD